MRQGKAWLRVIGMAALLGSNLTTHAQEARRNAPREDTVYVPGGFWVQLEREVFFVERDTFFLLGAAASFEILNSRKSQSFYDSLRVKSRRHRLTAQLHDLVLRTPRPSAADHELEQAGNPFLPYEGLLIGRITFQQVDLVDGSVDDPNRDRTRSLAGRTLNALHIDTRQSVLRRFLRFDAGLSLDANQLADTERLLRALSYIEDARIYVDVRPDNPRVADIRVVTKDRFSIGVEGSFRGLGRFRTGIYDNNFLGLGLEMGHQLLYNEPDPSPLGYQGRLHLNNLGSQIISADLNYINTDKIKEVSMRLDRGFFTPEVKYAGGFELTRTSRFRPQLASDGIEIDMPYRANLFDAWAGRSFELPGREVRTNLSVALRYAGIAFEERPPVRADDNFFFHKRNLALANVTFIRRRFFRSRNFTGFGDTEDIPTGLSLALTGGYDIGEFHRRPYGAADLAAGAWINHVGYFGLEATASAFRRDNRYEDGLLRLHGLYFTPMAPIGSYRFRQLVEVEYLRGLHRVTPADYLSFRHALRNYRGDLPVGQSRLVIRLESILFTPWNAYGFRSAFFAFGDLGYLSAQRPLIAGRQFRASLGLGVRLRNRSLILPTMEFRLVYLPRIDNLNRNWFADYNSTDPRLFLNLNSARPQLPGFGQ